MRDEPDDSLLRRVREGDVDAYAELFRRHWEPAVLWARRWLPAREAAEDAAAYAFTRTLRAIANGFGPVDGFHLYLFVAVKRSALQILLERSRDTREEHDLDRIHRDDEPTLDRRVAIAMLIEDTIASLPERQREAIRLIDVEGATLSSAAARMGVRPNAMSQLLHRARTAVRKAITATLTEPAPGLERPAGQEDDGPPSIGK